MYIISYNVGSWLVSGAPPSLNNFWTLFGLGTLEGPGSEWFWIKWFQLISIYFQLISIDFNLLYSIYFQLISIDFEVTFNWFQLISIYFQLISIVFQLISIDFQLVFNLLVSIYFQLVSIVFQLISVDFRFTCFNWFQLILNLPSTDFKHMRQCD